MQEVISKETIRAITVITDKEEVNILITTTTLVAVMVSLTTTATEVTMIESVTILTGTIVGTSTTVEGIGGDHMIVIAGTSTIEVEGDREDSGTARSVKQT